MDAENPSPVLWTDAFDESAFGRLRVSKLGIPWIVLRKDFLDVESSTLGLPVKILYNLSAKSPVEVDKLVDGRWLEVNERDWGAFNAKKA